MLPDTEAEGGDLIFTQDLEPERRRVMFLMGVFGNGSASQRIKLQMLKHHWLGSVSSE